MSDLALALADVRRACRLLHAYQRRVNDLFGLVVDGVTAETRLKYGGWYTTGLQRPARRGGEFFRDRWAWDMLPGQRPGVWLHAKNGDGTCTSVHIQVIADTGFDSYDGSGEPDAAGFASVEEERSELRFSVLRWPVGADEAETRAALSAAHPELYDGTTRRCEVDGGVAVFTYGRVELSELASAAAVRGRVTGPLVAAVAVR
jgi:hypothetical protein